MSVRIVTLFVLRSNPNQLKGEQMKKVLIVLALVTAFAFSADSYLVDDPIPGGASGTDDLLKYDDGTAHWLWSGVSWFGTWFDVTDFIPTATGFECDWTEWWYYHHANSPWDTDMIVVEIWSGNAAMPMTNLTSDDITALHYAPVVVNYATPVSTTADFWTIGNTTVYSAAGIPSQLYDEFDNFTGIPHSFLSQDFILWDPPSAAGYNPDAFNRCSGTILAALDSESWGAIKGLFR
jgi:hypothetical protein